MESMVDGLDEGDLVRLIYKSQSGNGRWYAWECTAVFLGRQEGDDLAAEDLTSWSLRPAAGTIQVPTRSLTSVVRVKTARQRLGRRGDDAATSPVRRAGAVPAPPARHGATTVWGAMMADDAPVYHLDHLNCHDAHVRAARPGDELHYGWAVGPDGRRYQHSWLVRDGELVDLFRWTEHEDLGVRRRF